MQTAEIRESSWMEELAFELTLRWVVRINQTPGVRAAVEKGLLGSENSMCKCPGPKQDDGFRNLPSGAVAWSQGWGRR